MSDDGKTVFPRSPQLGGARSERDPELWAALIGRDKGRRERAVRTINALERDRWYAELLLDALPTLQRWSLPGAGDSLALLGDPRLSPRHFLPEMIAIPAGSVILGSPEYSAEQPVHAVEIDAFSLAQYPITNAAYQTFVEESGYRSPAHWSRGGPDGASLNAPVTWVSARDAEAYCQWLNSETGYRYRLPSEAEWVLAARGPDDSRRFPWGTVFTPEAANAWDDAPLERLTAVGLFPAGCGPYGHGDLAGSVWEWCSSLFWRYPYRADDGREDPGADDERRVMHGGSWRSRPFSVRCSARQGELPADRFEVVGFRVARSV